MKTGGRSARCAAETMRPLGRLVRAGSVGGREVPLTRDELVRKEVRAAIRLTEAGRYPLDRMVTHRFPLKATAGAIRAWRGASAADGSVKVVVDPWR